MIFKNKKECLQLAFVILSLLFTQYTQASSTVICSSNRSVLPIATLSETRGNAPFKVNLDASKSIIGFHCSKFTAASYEWKSTDGQLTSGQKSSLIYDTPGIYQIELRVRNNHGFSGTTKVSVTVLDNTARIEELKKEYDKGLTVGRNEGKQACIQNPVSCGIFPPDNTIDLQQEFNKGFLAGQTDGKQSCIQDPESCGINIAITPDPINEFSVASEQRETELYLTMFTKDTITPGSKHYSILIENEGIGFQFDELSVAYLIQDGSLYQYTGDGSSWDWTYLKDLVAENKTDYSVSYLIALEELEIYSGLSYKVAGVIEDSSWAIIDKTSIVQKTAD